MSRFIARSRREYERWFARPDALWSFLQSVPGQVLMNTAALKLPEELRMKPEQRLLDVGCGAGALLRMFDAQVGFRERPVGVDFSGNALRLGRSRALRSGDPLPGFVAGSVTLLPFADASFDVAVSGHVLKHLPDWGLARMLREVRRVLKPGGLFVAWDMAPVGSSRLDAFNRWVLTRHVRSCNLRPWRRLAAAGRAAGFDYVADARLRPFLLPPIPRVSVLLGKAPEGWSPETT